MIATPLPDRHPEPTDQQTPHYPSGNLCRCGAILKSSRRQSSPHRSAKPVPRWPETSHEQSSVLRVAHICGRACELAGRSSNAIEAQTQAQAWPTRQPVRVIVPLTAGSAIDIVGRLVFEQVSKQIGQTVVIENRPGASQTIGAAAVAKADPDGYTVLVAGSALAVIPSTIANLPFNVQTDLTAVRRACERAAGDGGAAGEGI